MKRITIFAALAATLVFPLASSALAEISPPKVGETYNFACTGPYSKVSSYTIAEVKDGIVRLDMLHDGKASWLKKPVNATGLNLATEVQRNDGKGVRRQTLDEELLAQYAKLTLGWSRTFNVRARRDGTKMEWSYDVRVGEPKTIDHVVLGKIRVVPVYEKRKIWGGSYSSDLEEWVYPEIGFPIAWTYKDNKGRRECKLVGVESAG